MYQHTIRYLNNFAFGLLLPTYSVPVLQRCNGPSYDILAEVSFVNTQKFLWKTQFISHVPYCSSVGSMIVYGEDDLSLFFG